MLVLAQHITLMGCAALMLVLAQHNILAGCATSMLILAHHITVMGCATSMLVLSQHIILMGCAALTLVLAQDITVMRRQAKQPSRAGSASVSVFSSTTIMPHSWNNRDMRHRQCLPITARSRLHQDHTRHH